jgi:hypothetical protein
MTPEIPLQSPGSMVEQRRSEGWRIIDVGNPDLDCMVDYALTNLRRNSGTDGYEEHVLDGGSVVVCIAPKDEHTVFQAPRHLDEATVEAVFSSDMEPLQMEPLQIEIGGIICNVRRAVSGAIFVHANTGEERTFEYDAAGNFIAEITG